MAITFVIFASALTLEDTSGEEEFSFAVADVSVITARDLAGSAVR